MVHLQCINGYFVNIPRLITWLKKHHVKTVLTLHAEFMYTANCGHALDCPKWKQGCGRCPRRKQETGSYFLDGTARSFRNMKKAFEGFGEDLTILGASQWIAGRAVQSPIFAGFPVSWLYNGIRLDHFTPVQTPGERAYLQEKYGIPQDKRIILHVTPSFLSYIKGGDFFKALACRLPEEYQAVVVGNSGESPEGILSVPFTENQQDLAAIYRAADVLVIPSRADNYPTVCLEANCCGTPVVGFRVGGVAEAIGEGMGETVPAFDQEALLEKVLFWSTQRIPEEIIQSRIRFCDKDRMGEDYLRIYREHAGL